MTGPSYSEFLRGLEGALDSLPPSDCAQVLGDLERLKAIVWGRMLTVSDGTASSHSGADAMLLTLPQVAELLAIPTGHAYELARRDVLPVVRFGKYVRVSEASLTKWIGKQTTPQRRIDKGQPGLHSGTVTPHRLTQMPAKARPEPGTSKRARTQPVRAQSQSDADRLPRVKPAVEGATANDLISECSE